MCPRSVCGPEPGAARCRARRPLSIAIFRRVTGTGSLVRCGRQTPTDYLSGLAERFVRLEPHRQARGFLLALFTDLPRKNFSTIARMRDPRFAGAGCSAR